MLRCLIILLFCLAMVPAARAGTETAGGFSAGTPSGRWITPGLHPAVIQIAPCGAGLCGQIVGIVLAHPNDPMPLDWQGQPQCGLTIIQTAPVKDNNGVTTWKGTVIDPRNGTVYQARLALDMFRHLLLHGYAVLPIFGQTQTWTPFGGRTLANCRLAATTQKPPANG